MHQAHIVRDFGYGGRVTSRPVRLVRRSARQIARAWASSMRRAESRTRLWHSPQQDILAVNADSATGLPGSGKTTLAGKLANSLNLPLIAKDHFKEILFDTMGIGDRARSRKIGQAAIALQYDAMATMK